MYPIDEVKYTIIILITFTSRSGIVFISLKKSITVTQKNNNKLNDMIKKTTNIACHNKLFTAEENMYFWLNIHLIMVYLGFTNCLGLTAVEE